MEDGRKLGTGVKTLIGGTVGLSLVFGAYALASIHMTNHGELTYITDMGKVTSVHDNGIGVDLGLTERANKLPTTEQKTTVVTGRTSQSNSAHADGSANIQSPDVSCSTSGGEPVVGMIRINYQFDKAAIMAEAADGKYTLLNNLLEGFNLTKIDFADTQNVDPVEAKLNALGSQYTCEVIKGFSGLDLFTPPKKGEKSVDEKISEQIKTKLTAEMAASGFPIKFDTVAAIGVSLTPEARLNLAPILDAQRRADALEVQKKNSASEIEVAGNKGKAARAAFNVMTGRQADAAVPEQYALTALCLQGVLENPNLGPLGACLGDTSVEVRAGGNGAKAPSPVR